MCRAGEESNLHDFGHARPMPKPFAPPARDRQTSDALAGPKHRSRQRVNDGAPLTLLAGRCLRGTDIAPANIIDRNHTKRSWTKSVNRRASILIGAIALAMLTQALPAHESPASADDRRCATAGFSVPRDRIDRLARGFNLTGWLDNEDTVTRPDMTVLAGLRARGFTHIRLPIAPEKFMQPFTAPSPVARNLAQLDDALDRLHDLGFSVSLDLHSGDRLGSLLETNPEPALVLIKALWRKLARRYAARPADTLFFEVLNEPNIESTIWARWGPQLVDAIRLEAPDHTVVYAVSQYQRVDELTWHSPLAQANVVYAAHYYDPMIFTHQGLDWSDGPLQYLHCVLFPLIGSYPRVGRLIRDLLQQGHTEAADDIAKERGEAWDARRIEAAIGEAADWSKRNRVPVVINEFGVLTWKADPADRIRWLGTVSGAAESRCIGWAVWDYAEGFGFVKRTGNREIPDEAVLSALLGQPGKATQAVALP